MNAEPNQPERPEGDLAEAQDRIVELEQEIEAAWSIINERDVQIECLRIQLAEADLKIDEAAAARRKLEQRLADLEDDLADEPCPVQMSNDERTSETVALKFKPVPPAILKATDADLVALEALVGRLGWEELMYRLGVLISRQAQQTQGPHKGALEAAASLVNLWGLSFYWCSEENCRALMEIQNRRRTQGS